MRHFGDPGKSITTGINKYPLPPSKDDLLNPADLTSAYKYEHLILATNNTTGGSQILNPNGSHGFVIQNKPNASVTVTITGGDATITVTDELSHTGNEHLSLALNNYEKKLEKYLKISTKLINFLLTGINIEIQSALELVPAYKTALDDSLSFELFLEIAKKYGHTTNGRMIAHRTINGLQLKQTTTHEDFCHSIFKLEKTLNADLGGTCTTPPPAPHTGYQGFISIRSLVTIIYQMGLSQSDFAQRLEVFYSTNPTGIITGTLEDTMTGNSLYLNTKTAAITPLLEATSSLFTPVTKPIPKGAPKPTANTPWNKGPPNNSTPQATTTTPAKPYTHPVFLNNGSNTKCISCGKPFPTTAQTADPNKYHKTCKACYKKNYDARAATVAAHTPPPPAVKEVRFPTTVSNTDPKSAAAANKLMLAFLSQQHDDDYYDGPTSSLFTPSLTTSNSTPLNSEAADASHTHHSQQTTLTMVLTYSTYFPYQ